MTTDVARTTGVPDAVLLVRDFVNSAEPQVGGEDLTGPGALLAWATARDLLPDDAVLDADDVALAVAVREGMRGVLLAHAGHDVPAGAVEALDDALGRAPVRAAVDATGAVRLRAADDRAVSHLVAALLDAVRRAEGDGTWERLKVCAKDSCRWAFYDTSRNRSGRWCSMAGCGNQVKMQRAHARRRGAPSGDGASSGDATGAVGAADAEGAAVDRA